MKDIACAKKEKRTEKKREKRGSDSDLKTLDVISDLRVGGDILGYFGSFCLRFFFSH